VHGALTRKQSRGEDGNKLKMSLIDCMHEVWDLEKFMKCMDGLNLVSQQNSCRFMELQMVIEESSCEGSVAWEWTLLSPFCG
jgi:hypothetical protein